MSSKKIVASKFLEMCAMGNPYQAFNSYVHEKFIHHNQYFKGDRTSLLSAMEEDSKTAPNKSFEIKQLIEEGDRVVSYASVKKEDMDIAVVHILKFDGDKIIEMWDVGQVISQDSPNENGLF